MWAVYFTAEHVDLNSHFKMRLQINGSTKFFRDKVLAKTGEYVGLTRYYF